VRATLFSQLSISENVAAILATSSRCYKYFSLALTAEKFTNVEGLSNFLLCQIPHLMKSLLAKVFFSCFYDSLFKNSQKFNIF
jgi:hypothetical protein